ncbi:MAG: hypothetical protein JSR28_11795 [Proteobacteria bacterium]|nr:hypothetical protein [Pseudomonadota bacterium]
MRRETLLLAGLAALIPAAVQSAPAGAAPGTAQPRFTPPREVVLTRTVWRPLSDGEQILVTRRYAVNFAPEGDGFRLDGMLIDVAVDAPAELAPFAELERSRPDTMFPIVLDRTGRILSDGTPPTADTTLRAAALARATLSKAALSAPARAEALAQIPALSAAGGTSPVPADLFQPHPGERRETRKLALPGGMEGEVEVAIRVDGAGDGNLPQQVERVVTTRLAGSTKIARETWSFAPPEVATH